ncbi:MAG TPA: PSD1 and planctomycete cytochrome C domain-containing protein [Tepidisphaeraceae bacterium]|nr:PSD1 and planctomycete cytochrome C domain-containing protein [Tepidisphaeraceae bacterium]
MINKLLYTAAGLVTATACGLAMADAPVAKAKAPVVAAAPAAEQKTVLAAANVPAAAAAGAPGAVKLSPAESAFFETKVRPILVANCYSCHSIEEKKAKGGLTLDTREGTLKGGSHGPILAPGHPEASPLIKAIAYTDKDLQMPPDGDKLSDKDIATLTEWVKMGAPDPRVSSAGSALTGMTDTARSHWAFQPVKNPDVPAVQNKAWVKTPVDNFILAKLEANGMKPNPPAAKETLLRRATYDLTGLPPTPEEVQAFKNDNSPNAFEKVVDRLMASPRYGERWGRFWLDSARYSDTSGQENNNLRTDYRYSHAWTYRDYVIKSFNEDKPYDQFLMEQIAADQLPISKEKPETLAALGFLTVGKRFANNNDTIDERIDSLTKSTMALTVACARCHDHKFDPVPTADYYSLHGVFTSIVEPAERPLIGKLPSGKDYEDYKAKLAMLEAKNREMYYETVRSQGREFRKKAQWYLLVNMYARRATDVEAVNLRTKAIQEHKLERDLQQGIRIGGRFSDGVWAPLVRFSQLGKDEFTPAKVAPVLADIRSGKFLRRPLNPLVVAAFKDVMPESIKGMNEVFEIYGKLFGDLEEKAQAYWRANKEAVKPDTKITGYDEALVELLNIPAKVLPAHELDTDTLKEVIVSLPQQNGRLYGVFLFNNINELELTHPGAPARAMVVQDGVIKNSPIFVRGEAQNRGPIVPRQFLSIVSGKDRKPFKQGSGRLELAQAIASKDNPLTARVAVNRIWMRHVGEGFVRTVDDIGVQSEAPSHAELVDYLATRFVNEGWSFKKMHKLIMLSSTYQQSSDTNPAYAVKDPDNRLVWRANLRRLDFEAVRDTMLQFTGKLDLTVGGHAVNLTEEPYSNRRSVYGYIDRGSVPELMEQFDFSDPDMTNTKRTSTIVPQQALFFMNSAMSADVARKVVSRPEFVTAKDDYAKVRAIYQVIFQRAPRPEEVKMAADFYNAKVVADKAKGVDPLASATTAGKPAAAAGLAGKEARRAAAAAARKEDAAAAMMMAPRRNGKAGIKNEGETVVRKPLSVWEQYTQALLFSNEIAYVN